MHIWPAITWFVEYSDKTFGDFFIYKFIFAGILWLLASWITIHWTLVDVFITLFILDLITWVIKASWFRIMNSRAFFKWCTKLLVYGLFIILWEAIDVTFINLSDEMFIESLFGITIPSHLFLTWVLSYIIYTDFVSILENIEALWFHQVRPIKSFLTKKKKQYVDDKLWIVSQINVDSDFQRMKTVFIPLIPSKNNRRMFEVKIWILEHFVKNIATLEVNEKETFLTQYEMLLNNVWHTLTTELHKNTFKGYEIDAFLKRHYVRVAEYKEEVDRIIKTETTWDTLRNNIVQATIRIIYKWISDQIEAWVQ